MAPAKELRNILVVGAGGTNIGHHIALSLSKDPYFTVSILSRTGSKSTYPPNTHTITIIADPSHADYVAAFRGQDAIVSGLGFDGKTTEKAMIDAAIEAGVQRFVPSEYGIDNSTPIARALSPIFALKGKMEDYLISKESTGLTWTAVPNGMWLDWALDPATPFIGINIRNHTASYWSDGTYKLTFTTLPTAADGVRRILHHPVQTANRVLPIRNFEVSPAEIVTLLEEVQGVKYKITYVEDHESIIRDNRKKWEGEKSVEAALTLVTAGFLLPGYGSNFLEEGRRQVGNEDVGLDAGAVKWEEVVKEAVEKHGV